ncbi:MAG: filamentous hemagglutinin family protein [Pseudomonadota bacterium]
MASAPVSALPLAGMRNGAVSATANAAAAAIAAVQQAQQASQQSINNLTRAVQAVQAMQQAQAAARALARPSYVSGIASVPNGLTTGGLQVAPGVVGTTTTPSDPSLWQNAGLPSQSTANGQTTVTIQQTAPKAILTWQTFNVGAQTTVYFNQSAGNQTDGNNTWIALNRIIDPSGVPSQILGQIKAEGSVYLINANGIIFGGGSQVDVHTLVASSLGFLGENIAGLTPGSAAYDQAVQATNALFLNATAGGIAAPEATGANGAGGKGNLVLGEGGIVDLSNYVTPGPITIEPGASITTEANGAQSDGGFVLIAAPSVDNEGAITTPDGQAILAAGVGVSLLQPGSTSSSQLLIPELTGQVGTTKTDSNGNLELVQDFTPVGSLVNNGLIQATTGNVTLLGTNVNLGGTVEVTTSVSTPGSINISTVDEANVNDVAPNVPADRRAGQLDVSGIIANLPEDDGQSVPSDSTTFTTGKLTLTAGSVWLENGSLIEAPGASVSVAALTQSIALDATPPGDTAVQGRIYVDNGATIDVSGLADVELPMSDTFVTIGPITANDLADAPLQRNGFLYGKTIVVDSTLSGVSADGEAWVGTPLVDAEGYVEEIARTVDPLLTNAGSITLSGNQVMTASGSSLNLNGGYIHYLGGMVATTRLIDASGNLVNIANADPEDTYVGIAGQFSVDHAHWGVTQDFTAPLLGGSYYESDYIQGGNAGTLSVFGTQAAVLDGAMTAQAFPGLKQEEAGVAPSGTSTGGNYLPDGGSFILGAATTLTAGNGNNTSLSGETGSVIIQDYAPSLDQLTPDFGAGTPLNTAALNALGADDPDNILAWTTVPAVPLSNGGFANVTITMNRSAGSGAVTVAQGSTLTVQPGGSITINAGAPVTILGDLTAPSGTISIATGTGTALGGGGNITLGPDAVLDAAGEWVNDSNQPDAVGANNFINGGSVSLVAAYGGSTLLLSPGSVIDVSSGGAMNDLGELAANSNGIPLGKGGSVTLETGTYFSVTSAIAYVGGPIVMDGTIESWGFAGGGTLTLQAPGIQIGGDPASAPASYLTLPADFFESQGFGAYVLNAFYDTTVVAGTTVRLTQQTLIPNVAALARAPSGANLNANGLTTRGTLDPYDRQATNLVLTAGGDLFDASSSTAGEQYTVAIGAGASILADAGASIGLGSPGQVTVLGSIIAPGGSIILSADDGNGNGYEQTGQVTTSYTSPGKSVWLGADAVLDVAGVAMTDPFATPVHIGDLFTEPTTGKVLDGGSIVLSDSSGIVVAQAGSVVDVSGTEATFDEPQGTTSGLVSVDYAPQPVWSNAGSITLAASGGLYFDGTLEAHAGAAQGEGGTLTILPEVSTTTATQPDGSRFTMPAAIALVLQQSGSFVPAGLTPGEALTKANADAPTGTLQFAVDRLQGSGIDTLVVGGAVNAASDEVPLVPVAFVGNVDLVLGRAVEINTSELAAISTTELGYLLAGEKPDGTKFDKVTSLSDLLSDITTSVGAPIVSIDAPYVAIGGVGSETLTNPTAALADATLTVNAAFIDLENQFSLENFGQANFTSTGDIRLSSTITAGVTTNTFFPGELYTPGNLTFTAADLYPASGESFILDASGSQATTITFQSNGTSSVPLSAGGSLLVDATNIIQAGTIRAPSGTIVLGVGDKTNSATQTEFASLPLTNTQSVTLASGSTTSVSLDGASIPYGTTTDSLDWQYDEIAGDTTNPDLTAPPPKIITINGSNVTLATGATVDLSGGGDLYATEWVAGTGGSRNVLSQYNVTYPASGAAVATPLFPDARNVYAIVPSYEAPVAAYDPVYAQTVQPATTASGSATTQTDTIGVGAAALDAQVGQAVYLSGVPGLPAGTYVLLPAQYATLPGAYRVVENTGASNVVPDQSVTLPDGTHIVSGYYVDALSGARSSTPVQFTVQSAAVWGQYSQYTLTSANSYFASQAASNGTATPPLPVDAGQLALAASQTLILDATLRTAAGPGGLAAEVDIASQDIEIVGQGEQALAGYLQLSADSLDALGAGSLLIGGIRTATSSGISIDAIANSVVVANDANDPLTGPEIILVTKTDPAGDDPNAKNGLRVESGSVIEAKGSLPASAAQPITFGSSTISGDGALLRVSNAGQVTITRDDLPANAIGSLTVQAGANLVGGAALTLDSSGSLNFAPSANFAAMNIAIDAPAITLTNATGAALAGLSGFVVGPQNLGQFASAQQVDLRSYGSILFDGNVNLAFGQNVELSAGSFVSNGGNVTISAPTVAFTNDLGATEGTATAGAASLNVNANTIDLGSGSKALAGFGSVNMTATGGIVGQNTGSFDMGGANVTLAAPVYLADTSSQTSLTTTGALVLNSNQGTALALNPVGGAISFTAGTLNVNGASIEAPAGNVTLEAKTGDLTVASGSLVSSQGVAKRFFDVTEYSPAGNITLTADEGAINVALGAVLNFSGAAGGGAAGKLTLSAPVETVNLNGTILGNAAAGYQGGAFALNTGGSVDLDNLADELAASGVTQSISVVTGAGNLVLSAGNILTARVVSLTADGGTGDFSDSTDGNILINGTINASGTAGGTIALYGKSSVDLEGALIATGSSATEQGGTVNIGTTAVFDPNAIDPATGKTNPYNATYGYENFYTSGVITLGANAIIDVAGGTKGGLSGGTVSFRAPILADGATNADGALNTQGDVNIFLPTAFNANRGILGSRATTLEAYAVWSTTDATGGTGQPTAAQHFDGIVDPAGWYTSNGTLVSGSFVNASGTTVASWNGSTLTNDDGTTNNLSYYLTNDYFMAPGSFTNSSGTVVATWSGTTLTNVDGTTNTLSYYLDNDSFLQTGGDSAHQTFYGYGLQTAQTTSNGTTTTTITQVAGTLMGFVENLPISADVASRFTNAGVQNFAVAPGIELDNPDPNINGGNISILTNWNLGAGSSATELAFRFNGAAPIITFRAENDVKVDASLSDGFFQIANPNGASIAVPSLAQYGTFAQDEALYNQPAGVYAYLGGAASGIVYYATHTGALASAPQNLTAADPSEVDEYYALYAAYGQFLDTAISSSDASLTHRNPATDYIALIANNDANGSFNRGLIAAPIAPTPSQTLAYFNAYISYIDVTYPAYVAAVLGKASAAGDIISGQYIAPPQPPNAQLFGAGVAFNESTITVGTTDNTPSPAATPANPLPILFASLATGSSASYNIVAGANLTSANPLAVQATALFANGGGSVTLDDHTAYVDANGQTINTPTMIRTGTGSIDIAAANNVSLLDTIAPGVIYTGGAPAGTSPGTTESIVTGNKSFGAYDVVATNAVNPDGAGNVSIVAGNDITGVESVSGISGGPTGYLNSQFWYEWMQTGNVANSSGTVTQTSINFGAFDQGVMSVGGNVTIAAGGDITNLAVSLPTTWYLSNGAPITVGGGNLTVTAGGNILSGDYFVANGTGALTAGGQIASSGLTYGGSEVSTILAAQDGVLNVSARQGVDIGAMVDPSYLQGNTLVDGYSLRADAQSYSASSALNVVSTTGAVSLNTLADPLLLDAGKANSLNDDAYVLPASVDLTAFSGGINIEQNGELYPSATGELSLVAAQSVDLYDSSGSTSLLYSNYFGMIDASPSALPSPTNQMPTSINGVTNEFLGDLNSNSPIAHSESALHADDTQPVLIYSLTGSITDGVLASDGNYNDLLQIAVDKPAEIEAGQNIVNLAFLGQNLRDDDLTSVIAGRDISDSKNFDYANNFVAPALVVGGPGAFLVQAGRNIGPLTNQQEIYDREGTSYNDPTTGIDAVGNADDPFLPHESANVQVLFGVGPGIDASAFIDAYIGPDASVPGIDTSAALVTFMEQYDEGQGLDTGLVTNNQVTLTFAQAWSQFQALPLRVQQLFAEDTLFEVLQAVGNDYNNSASPYYHQYSRGYQAINTLFPAAYGYTANSLDGGTNGANQLVDTGNLDIRSTTIQTQQGGNVVILGPGGEALVGSESAPPVIMNGKTVEVGPGAEGILTLEDGNVDIFTDQSLLLAQSRVFTEEGGDMTIWSSNGDINAGKGAKTVANVPAPIYVSDEDHYNTRDARGEVSGAGIATLAAIPGVPPGNVNLIAPRGTVDAGAAGIRVSGDLNIAALQVVNAFNIQVQGVTTGVPTVAAPNVGSLSDASAASGAATKAITSAGQGNNGAMPASILIVEIEGYGGDDETTPAQQPNIQRHDRDKTRNRQSYSTQSPYQVLGAGALSSEEIDALAEASRQQAKAK